MKQFDWPRTWLYIGIIGIAMAGRFSSIAQYPIGHLGIIGYDLVMVGAWLAMRKDLTKEEK